MEVVAEAMAREGRVGTGLDQADIKGEGREGMLVMGDCGDG